MACLVLAVSFIMNDQVAHAETQQAVAADQIKDGLSPEEFRAYGKTSPAVVNTRVGTLAGNGATRIPVEDLATTLGGFPRGAPMGWERRNCRIM